MDSLKSIRRSVLRSDADVITAIFDRKHPELVRHIPGEPDVRILVEADRDDRGGGPGIELRVEDIAHLGGDAYGVAKRGLGAKPVYRREL